VPDDSGDLGELQYAVMEVLWARGDATVQEVVTELSHARRPAYTTILTVLRALERRGYVRHACQDGTRKFRYTAVISAEETRRRAVRDAVARVFRGSAADLITCVLDTEPLSEADLDRVRGAVRDHTTRSAR
jgi:predicted transcriptional regulator